MREAVSRGEDELGKGLGDSPPHQPLVTQSLHPDSPPAEQLQQLLAEAGLAEMCMSVCVMDKRFETRIAWNFVIAKLKDRR